MCYTKVEVDRPYFYSKSFRFYLMERLKTGLQIRVDEEKSFIHQIALSVP